MIEAELRLGEIIFNSPALLGGQAEKTGLSCGSCHRNGRGNPDFQFEAVSGPAGTADVTSGLFSKVRADNRFNPVPIPDLALPDGRDQVDRRDRAGLAGFVRGQIEDEFSGDAPSDEMFEPLLTYLQYIDEARSACQVEASIEVGWMQDWQDAELAAAQIGLSRDDQTRAFFVRTARLSLGRIHDRYAGPDHVAVRAALVSISRNLEAGQSWPAETSALKRQLENAQAGSLYSATALAQALRSNGN